MVDFTKLAQHARAKYDGEVSAAAEKRRLEAETRRQLVDAGIAVLTAHVKPLLEKAVCDLRAEGIELQIGEKFDVYNFAMVLPTLSAMCLGPKRKSDGYQFKSEKVFFSSDGKSISVGRAGDDYGDHMKTPLGSATPDKVGALVEKAIGLAVDAHFRVLKEHPAWVMNR